MYKQFINAISHNIYPRSSASVLPVFNVFERRVLKFWINFKETRYKILTFYDLADVHCLSWIETPLNLVISYHRLEKKKSAVFVLFFPEDEGSKYL